jgi:hypothetical protein
MYFSPLIVIRTHAHTHSCSNKLETRVTLRDCTRHQRAARTMKARRLRMHTLLGSACAAYDRKRRAAAKAAGMRSQSKTEGRAGAGSRPGARMQPGCGLLAALVSVLLAAALLLAVLQGRGRGALVSLHVNGISMPAPPQCARAQACPALSPP